MSHTHWDRAWYCTFQEFRIRLVRLIDRLIDLLTRDRRFKVFMLDGQLSVLEDYLEVRPDQEEAIRELVQSSRITIGPWYVLPDEFLVSPEALIRNLMLGHRMGERFGGVIKVGYVPDGFGHIAQLPQILNGFGINSVFFWRGVGEEADVLGTDFRWFGMDGSSVTAVFMPWGYHNVSNIGYVIRWGDTSQMEFDWDLGMDQLRDAVDALKPMSRLGIYLLMNGIDHAEAESRIPELVQRANAQLADIEIIQGTLLDYLKEIGCVTSSLPEFRGEFRWGRYSEILQGVYSTRIHLKQENHRVENLLERYTEPLDAMAWLSGAPPVNGSVELLWQAWKWLLKNHPHDDIYGSGIDRIHEEMEYRFSQARQIALALMRDNTRLLSRQIDCTAVSGMPVIVVNPLNWERNEVAIAELDFDFDDPAADSFKLVDNSGISFPHQVLSSEEVIWMETLKPNRKKRVKMAMRVTTPPCGYAMVFAQPNNNDNNGKVSQQPGVEAGRDEYRRYMVENSFLRLSINNNGTFDLHDKTTGADYSGLHLFRDVEDSGDAYSFSSCIHSKTVETGDTEAGIELLQNGPLVVTFQIHVELLVPLCLIDDRTARSSECIPLAIVSELSVFVDRPGVYVKTFIDNRVKDHKLSVVFPTDLLPHNVQVDESFFVASRSLTLPSSKEWVEDPTSLMHQRSFTDLSIGKKGLAVLNRGLPSVEVQKADNGTEISLTLLRCVGWLSRDDLANRRVAAGPLVPVPEAQCQGKYIFEYAVLPHEGDWKQIYHTAGEFVTPLHVSRADTHEGMELREMPFIGVDLDYFERQVKRIPWPRKGTLPPALSFYQLTPACLIISAFKRNALGDGIVLRFYNMGEQEIIGTLSSYLPLETVYLLNLNEERQFEIPLQDEHTVQLEVQGWQVITCELR